MRSYHVIKITGINGREIERARENESVYCESVRERKKREMKGQREKGRKNGKEKGRSEREKIV